MRCFECFLPANYNYATDDATSALVAAAAWSAANATPVRFAGRYRLGTNAVITDDNLRFFFEDAQFDVLDTDTSTLTNGAAGPIGVLFQNAANAEVLGNARFVGLGTAGMTRLAGLIFDSCANVRCGDFSYRNMAMGMGTFWCDDGRFGDVVANDLYGRQTFDTGSASAGSAVVVAGCRRCTFGDIASWDNHKPILYCSVALDAEEEAIDIEQCRFGFVTGSGRAESTEGSLISVRSARDCSFAGGSGTGFSLGLYLVRYDTDDEFSIDGNVFDTIGGSYPGTDASVDAVVLAESFGAPIGSNYIGNVVARCGTGLDMEYGVRVTSGELGFGHIEIAGSTRPVAVFDAALRGESIVVSGQHQEAVSIGENGTLIADWIDVRSGSRGGVASAVRAGDLFGGSGPASVQVNRIRYRHNGVGTDVLIVYLDLDQSPQSASISHIDGTGTSAQARWLSDEYAVRNARLLRAAIPTGGAFTIGDLLWNAAPAIDGSQMVLTSWSRLTTGTGNTLGTDWAVCRTSVTSPAV